MKLLRLVTTLVQLQVQMVKTDLKIWAVAKERERLLKGSQRVIEKYRRGSWDRAMDDLLWEKFR